MGSGIYQIRNIVNGKIYIGSAVNLYKRKIDHFTTLVKNKHHNDYLQKSYNKYGKDAFTFEVLFTCLKEDLIRLEQYHINNYNPEYNICRVAGSVLGVKRSEQTKIKMSKSQIGKKHSEETKKKQSIAKKGTISHLKKPICQLALDGIVINQFPSIKDAAVNTSIGSRTINNCLTGRSFTAGGYKWKYVNG